jgi:hypothetical protein
MEFSHRNTEEAYIKFCQSLLKDSTDTCKRSFGSFNKVILKIN